MAERLHRLDRLYADCRVYFVTACAHVRKSIIANKSTHDAFVTFCETGLQRGVFVGRYVSMPDHLHLFVRFGKEYEQELMERLKRKNATLIERRYRNADVAAVYDRPTKGSAEEPGESLHVSCLSSWMKSLKNSLSKSLNAAGHSAPHWQKGFFDHVMRSGESYSEKWKYMVENPVRAELVNDWKDWPWQGEIYPLQF